MKASDLKSCPFCGGKAVVNKHRMFCVPKWVYAVKCSKCGATSCFHSLPKNQAFEAWNRRVDK